MTDFIKILPEKIEFYDDKKVGHPARRLAAAFNTVARAFPEEDPIPQAEKLFLSTTGLREIPAFNDDEINYLRHKLIETAAIQGRVSSLEELRQAANQLFMEAEIRNIIRREDTFDKRKDMNSSCGSEGP